MSDDTTTLAALAARLDAVEAENRSLRAEVDSLRGDPPGARHPVSEGGPMGRRQALRTGLAAAGAAAAAVVVTEAAPAAAANGGNLVMGVTTNTATLPTRLSVTGTGAGYGFGVVDNSPSAGTGLAPPALLGQAIGQSFSCGVRGIGEGATIGMYASSNVGTGLLAESTSGTGVVADSNTGVALRAQSDTGGAAKLESIRYHLELSGAAPSPPLSGVAHSAGEIVRDANGTLWFCTATGTPGTWRRLAGPTTAGAFHLLPTPVRVYDSRPGTDPDQGPKTPLPADYGARTIDLKEGGAVPAGATGALVTILLVNATAGPGNMTIWANDKPKPASNSMVWGGDAGRFTGLAATAVDAQARVKVDALLPTHLVLDVVGYYR